MVEKILAKDEILVQMSPFGEGSLDRVISRDALRKMSSPQQLLEYMVKVAPPTGREAVVYSALRDELKENAAVELSTVVLDKYSKVNYIPTTMDVISRSDEPKISVSALANHKVGYIR